jgi:hypothetical protein
MRSSTVSAKRNSSPQRNGWKRCASEVVPVFGRPTPMRWNRRAGREAGPLRGYAVLDQVLLPQHSQLPLVS